MADLSKSPGELPGSFSIVAVLPNGMRQLVDTTGLETFADFKRKIELTYGLPYEIQNIIITNGLHPVADWELVRSFKGEPNTEVYVRSGQEWTTFVSVCLREAVGTVLDFLETTETESLFHTRLYVALFIAVSSGDKSFVSKLLGLGPNVSKRSASGRNILHLVVATGDIELTKLVLDYNCIDLIEARDVRGETPLDIAVQADDEELVELLLSEVGERTMDSTRDSGFTERKGRKISRASASNSLRVSSTAGVEASNLSKYISHSTPSSPQLRRVCRNPTNLGRGKTDDYLAKTFDSNASQGKVSNQTLNLPSIHQTPGKQNSSAGFLVSSRPMSGRQAGQATGPNSPAAPNTRAASRSPQSIRNARKFSAPDSSKNATQFNNSQRGVQQVVFLPPWRRDGRRQSSQETKALCGESEEPETQLDVQPQSEFVSEVRPRSDVRSHSVASISAEDVRRLQEEVRVKKPWNEWRRISLMGKREKKDLFRDIQKQTAEEKISFEKWLIGKEVMRDEYEEQILLEDRLKQLEKERIEEERKTRYKSYNTWLAEKEVEKEESKEEEKRKEEEKKVTEEKLQIRKTEAERKYEKWMRTKYEEELRQEEELQKRMQEKWKLKKEEVSRRKSVAAISTTKKALSKSTSVPI